MKFLSILSALSLFLTVDGHGFVASPRSRNWVAQQDGLDWGTKTGVPPREYCPHCLNRNDGVCGTSPSFGYDEWLDSFGNPMPWMSQGTFGQGEIIHVNMIITAHHYGHMELKACPNGRASTQDCFEANPLLFVRDTLYDMPADPRCKFAYLQCKTVKPGTSRVTKLRCSPLTSRPRTGVPCRSYQKQVRD
jgi:hypothetical protein